MASKKITLDLDIDQITSFYEDEVLTEEQTKKALNSFSKEDFINNILNKDISDNITLDDDEDDEEIVDIDYSEKELDDTSLGDNEEDNEEIIDIEDEDELEL